MFVLVLCLLPSIPLLLVALEAELLELAVASVTVAEEAEAEQLVPLWLEEEEEPA